MIPRPRPASQADGAVCVPLIAEAGGELLAWAMNGDADRSTALIERCWQARSHPLGASNTLVIEAEDRVLAAVVGAPSRRWSRAERSQPIALAGLGPPAALQAITERLAAQRAARPSLDPRAWYLSSLGVVPSSRRRGLGRMLLAETLTRTRSHGLQGVVVEVVEGNHAARSLYASAGFSERCRWTPTQGPCVLRLYRPVR